MTREEYTQLRQKLAELYAGRRLAGEPGLTAAGTQLLRRVENLEALSGGDGGGACDMGEALAQLCVSIHSLPQSPVGLLRTERPAESLPVGLGWRALHLGVLNLIWVLAQGHPRETELRLKKRKTTALCDIRAMGKLLPPQPGALCPPGQWAENLSDGQLALAAAQAIIHRAGGGLVLSSGVGVNTATFWLPLCEDVPLSPCPTAGELLEDRFSVLNVVLGSK